MPFLAGLGPLLPMLLGGAGTAIGAIAGAAGGNQNEDINKNVAPLDPNAQNALGGAYGAFQNIQQQANSALPSTQGANANLAAMLQQLSQTGGVPNQGQIQTAQNYAQQAFAPQQAALQNQFNQAQMNTNQQAALLGRPINDPVLQGKLAQYQGQQQGVLQGQQGALANQVAFGLPQQQLNFQQQLANQAFQNQAQVLGMGQGLAGQQQQFNLGASNTNVKGQSGGGLGGGLLGALSGLGGGIGLSNQLAYPNIFAKLNGVQPTQQSFATGGNDSALSAIGPGGYLSGGFA